MSSRLALSLAALGLALAPASLDASCTVQGPGGPSSHPDALGALLEAAPRCPEDVFQLRALFGARGVRTDTTLVGNRGFHNPDLGSFSLFECAKGRVRGLDRELGPGDLFWGHFTARGPDGRLVPDQVPRRGALMIEVVSWDPEAEVYRFYELIGDGRRGRWFYRGDSLDILEDTAALHLPRAPDQPVFGERLRCSGCHVLGGPIMKEIARPHEAWWRRDRALPFGPGGPGPRLAEMLTGLVDAGELATNVQVGVRRLLRGEAYRSWRRRASLRQVLRPLFAPLELELAAGGAPLDEAGEDLELPSGLLRDPRLAQRALRVDRRAYLDALEATDSRFPEVTRRDADHPWLGPVKAWSEREWARVLVEEGIVSEDLVTAALGLDPARPVFSPLRARALIDWIPDRPFHPGWMDALPPEARRAMAQASRLRAEAAADLAARAHELGDPAEVEAELRRQQGRRQAIRESEISRNPRGQILEPGFRVIFPEPHRGDRAP